MTKFLFDNKKTGNKARLFLPLASGNYEITRTGGLYTPGYRATWRGKEFVVDGFGDRTGIFKRQPYFAIQACNRHYELHNAAEPRLPSGFVNWDWEFSTRPDGAKLIIRNRVYSISFYERGDRYGKGGAEIHRISLDGQSLATRYNLFHALAFVENHAEKETLQ